MGLWAPWKKVKPVAGKQPDDTATQFEFKIRSATMWLIGFYAVACPVLGVSLSPHLGRDSLTIMFSAALIAFAFACAGALLGFILGSRERCSQPIPSRPLTA